MVPMVRGSQGIQNYHGAKVNKDAEKNRTVARTLHTADYLYFYFFICSAALVSSVIASD